MTRRRSRHPRCSSSPLVAASAVRAARPGRRSSPTRPRSCRRWPPGRAAPAASADPLPVVLPRDDGPHDRLTEWWYYTGHLRDAATAPASASSSSSSAPSAARFPTSWVSHLAITDETGDRFPYSQRLEVGPQVDRSPLGRTASPSGSTWR